MRMPYEKDLREQLAQQLDLIEPVSSSSKPNTWYATTSGCAEVSTSWPAIATAPG